MSPYNQSSWSFEIFGIDVFGYSIYLEWWEPLCKFPETEKEQLRKRKAPELWEYTSSMDRINSFTFSSERFGIDFFVANLPASKGESHLWNVLKREQ